MYRNVTSFLSYYVKQKGLNPPLDKLALSGSIQPETRDLCVEYVASIILTDSKCGPVVVTRKDTYGRLVLLGCMYYVSLSMYADVTNKGADQAEWLLIICIYNVLADITIILQPSCKQHKRWMHRCKTGCPSKIMFMKIYIRKCFHNATTHFSNVEYFA